MVVDLGRCVGCQTCTIACKMENGLPPGTLWRTVVDVEGGEYPDVNRAFVPLTCMHCADPPYDACPTTATRVRADGIVWIDNALCIGCGSCVVACPYRARHLIPKERYYFGAATPPELATYDRSRVGICTKCHFCSHKFDEAPAAAVPGRDPAYTPACASSCIANAIVFGDLDDPADAASRLAAERGPGATMLEHLGTRPSVVYLNVPRIERQPPTLQTSWHGLAVSNFFFGTAGTGLYLLSTLLSPSGVRQAPLLDWSRSAPMWTAPAEGWPALSQWAGLFGPLLVAIGLLSVAAEAGRPLRGFNVLRNLRRSWMARESAFAMLFMLLALGEVSLWPHPALKWTATVAGLGVTLSQGLILSKAKGVPAWNVRIMPLLFVSSGALAGAGILLLFASATGSSAGKLWLVPLGLGLCLADWAVWHLYLATPPKTATFSDAVAVLRRPAYSWSIVGLGHGVPALLLALAWGGAGDWALLLAGTAILAGALMAKFALVRKAGFLVDLFDRFGETGQRRIARPAGTIPSGVKAA
jgi:phenylacetyl-CoA:acceptor oxidoreductase subunit 1